ncbi:hypothetical protein K1T35_16965 [Pseudonocardia sp. DSM 110487]|uniref:hypothetical protein n=1 Tax=Pseudonocardia sp. DSM 110487 TaxID=2865833 RepID=UPI001C69F345|nr:hypothetical protein [Pseudonocardia sp. DSM 110487]QYN38743.1 hypothetical protein K1T35_16965 [Pseudonocardia sp. DSM 110487]
MPPLQWRSDQARAARSGGPARLGRQETVVTKPSRGLHPGTPLVYDGPEHHLLQVELSEQLGALLHLLTLRQREVLALRRRSTAAMDEVRAGLPRRRAEGKLCSKRST